MFDFAQDKAMMGRWGLEGMESFKQKSVARKEGAALKGNAPLEQSNTTSHN